jgi:endonuclease/exonuclease/phosphatase family metal-dependent hydrolase
VAAPALAIVIRIGTYNVHGFVGRDGRRDLERVAGVIRSLGCRAIGLQEVDSRGAATTLVELERLTGMRAVAGATITQADGDYGNALLTSAPVSEVHRHDLSVPGREPRGALEATLQIASGSPVTVMVTHLGLHRRGRRRQIRRLLELVERTAADRPLVLVGDFNEWWPWAPPLRRLSRIFGNGRAVPTFPAHRPLLALDRVWAGPGSTIRDLRASSNAETRVASDHLPLTADIDFSRFPDVQRVNPILKRRD